MIKSSSNQTIREAIVEHLKLLYPYSLSVFPPSDLLEHLKKVLLPTDIDLARCSPAHIGRIFSYLTHIFQQDMQSKWKKGELYPHEVCWYLQRFSYVQLGLLPHITKLLVHVLTPVGKHDDTRSLLFYHTSITINCTELLSCITLQTIPSMWHQNQQRSTNGTLKNALSQFMLALWSPMVLFAKLELCNFPIRDGLLSICVS